MKLRTAFVLSMLVNVLLIGAVAAVATHRNWWGKAVGALTGAPVLVGKTGHYKRMLDIQRASLSQALASTDVQVAFSGDSIVEMWLTSVSVPNSINLGISGDTIPAIVDRADMNAIEHIPVWYVGIGVNDAIRDTDIGMIPQYVEQLAASYGRAETLYWRAVLPVAREGWNDSRDDFRTALNDRSRETCARMENCVFLEVPDGYARNIEVWTIDGLHPNVAGYRALTRQFCQYVTCAPDDG